MKAEGSRQMAKDPGKGYKIKATVVDKKGPCNAGHEIGDSFDISCYDCGGLCGWMYHDIFPDLQVFQFGGVLPWWPGDEVYATCKDPNVQVTVRLVRSKR